MHQINLNIDFNIFLRLSGESPFKGQDEETTFTNIAYNRYNALSLYENITKEALKFIFRVLKRVARYEYCKWSLYQNGCCSDILLVWNNACIMVRLTDFFFNLYLNYRLSCLNNVIFDLFFWQFSYDGGRFYNIPYIKCFPQIRT